MSDLDKEELKVSKKAYLCGHCANKALMYVICEGRELYNDPENDRVRTDIYVLKCPSCHR
jgi:hypothetical protein